MRFKELSLDEMTEPQRTIYHEAHARPKGRMGAPTYVLIRSPELANCSKEFAAYIRSENLSLPRHIKEFAILISARHWTAQFEWYAHCEDAIKAGLSAEVAAELALGKRPSGMKDEVAAAYEFCTELLENKNVSDAVFDTAIKQFGEKGVVDLIGVLGHYALVSMALNINKTSLPPGVPLPLPPLN